MGDLLVGRFQTCIYTGYVVTVVSMNKIARQRKKKMRNFQDKCDPDGARKRQVITLSEGSCLIKDQEFKAFNQASNE